MVNYNDEVKPLEKEFVKVSLSSEKMKEINKFSSRIAVKSKDGGCICSMMGTAAVEEVLKMPISNIMMDNSHEKLMKPLVLKHNIGIKCAKIGQFPVVFKNTDSAQIICLADAEEGCVYVCGVATPEIINKYSDDSLLPDIVRVRNVKTMFYGFSHLLPISVLTDKVLSH